MSSMLTAMILSGVGMIAVAGAVCDWDWFMHSRRVRVFILLLGRDGARVFYASVGLIVMLLAMSMTMVTV